MRLSRAWRVRMQEEILRSIAGMDRDLTELLRGWDPARGQLESLSALGYSGGGEPQSDYRRGALDSIREQSASRDENYGDDSDSETWDTADAEGLDLGEALESEERLAASPAESDRMELPSSAPPMRQKQSKRVSGSDEFFLGRPGKAGLVLADGMRKDAYGRVVGGGWGWSGDPFESLFPTPGGIRPADPDWKWSPKIQELLARLDRHAALDDTQRGWLFQLTSMVKDSRGRNSTSRALHLIGPQAWLNTSQHVEGQLYSVEWVRDGVRGILAEGWRLGRVRAAEKKDAASWPAPFAWHFGDRARMFAAYEARLLESEPGLARIEFALPSDVHNRMQLVIDVEREVVLEQT
jgi:hypothetical protein